MTEEKKYSGYGYHGGGRKPTGIKRVSICISGQPEQIEELKKKAALERKTVSAFILEKTGILQVTTQGEAKAKALAAEMQEKEPDVGWEAMNGEDE